MTWPVMNIGPTTWRLRLYFTKALQASSQSLQFDLCDIPGRILSMMVSYAVAWSTCQHAFIRSRPACCTYQLYYCLPFTLNDHFPLCCNHS